MLLAPIPLLVMLFLVTTTLCGRAQEAYSVSESSFLPVRFYVGDEVELRLRLQVTQAELEPPRALPSSRWLTVEDVQCNRYRPDEWVVRIHFVTFKPGSHTLPALDLGGLHLENIKVETRSILGDSEQTRPAGLKGQLGLPGTTWKLTVLILSLLAAPGLLLYGARLIRRVYLGYRELRRRLEPRKRILRELRRLLGRLEECPQDEFFSQITRLLREYFQRRFAVPAPMSTTEELRGILAEALAGALSAEPAGRSESPVSSEEPAAPARPPFGTELSERVVRLLRRADWVRFGSFESSPEEMRETVAAAVAIVETIEGEAGHVER